MKESFEASRCHKYFDYLWSQNGLRMSQISMFQLTLRKLGLCVCSLKAFVECWVRNFLYKFLNKLIKKSSPKVPYERLVWSIWSWQMFWLLVEPKRTPYESHVHVSVNTAENWFRTTVTNWFLCSCIRFFLSTSLNIFIWDPITCRQIQETSVMMMH